MLIKKNIQNMEPYISGYQPLPEKDIIKLNSNENPYPPSPQVRKFFAEMDYSMLRYYPNSSSQGLRDSISSLYGIPMENILCGNGSDEIISLIFKVFLNIGDKIVTPYPTYTLYKTVADINQVLCQYIQTGNDFRINIQEFIDESSNAIFIANPNAQTGSLLPLEDIEYLLQNYRGLVVIDEAYIDFAKENSTALPLIQKYPNLIVIRTFSKAYSLCGARVGYCFADSKIINGLDKCKESYNVNYISQEIAKIALEDQTYLENTISEVIRARTYLRDQLKLMEFEVLPSQANFLLCRPLRGDAKEIYEYLVRQKIYVRYFDSERLNDKLRISIGTITQCDTLLHHLRTFYSIN
ncbi:histidinol-phosphate transaminase [Paenibacillus woosongensis]|uniref:Histidinol-phosphate aminotransferase n=1 Tax=Paenibacillus woosongensis TaxID=307580 RepID=A0AA95L1P3_9BACL|nr:histidinol-phosphate transaminase [Paenibacillus woosongensis]WHX50199.1 histidinol-phosphate transaminase [Paenibacillus woosongensis]